MSFRLSNRSKERLIGVHGDLVKVVHQAIQLTSRDFFVGEGLRTPERQQKLYDQGASTTLNSRHLTGHAVDLHPYPYNGDYDGDGVPNGADWDEYYPISEAMLEAAGRLGVDLEWGGHWRSFKDGPHFQLSRRTYP